MNDLSINGIGHLNAWITHLYAGYSNQTLSKDEIEKEISEIKIQADTLMGHATALDLQTINRRVQLLRQRINPLIIRQFYTFDGAENYFQD